MVYSVQNRNRYKTLKKQIGLHSFQALREKFIFDFHFEELKDPVKCMLALR